MRKIKNLVTKAFKAYVHGFMKAYDENYCKYGRQG